MLCGCSRDTVQRSNLSTESGTQTAKCNIAVPMKRSVFLFASLVARHIQREPELLVRDSMKHRGFYRLKKLILTRQYIIFEHKIRPNVPTPLASHSVTEMLHC